MTTKTKTSKDKVAWLFAEKKKVIDDMIARLQEISEDHFGVGPDEVHYGHVGSLGYAEELLRRALEATESWMPPKYEDK